MVGRDLQRDPETVLAKDIAWFPPFRWEPSFEYQVDWDRKLVTVEPPDAPARSAKDWAYAILGLAVPVVLKLAGLPAALTEITVQAFDPVSQQAVLG